VRMAAAMVLCTARSSEIAPLIKSRELINLLAPKIGSFPLPLIQGFDRRSAPEGRVAQLVVKNFEKLGKT